MKSTIEVLNGSKLCFTSSTNDNFTIEITTHKKKLRHFQKSLKQESLKGLKYAYLAKYRIF